KVSTFFETNNEKVELNKDDLKKSLSQKVIKELEYMIPLSAKIVDVNHDFKVDKNILTYTITVKTSENIAQIYNLDNNEAESIIKNQTGNGDNNQDEEETPSNPEKRPINDIRNKFEPEKKEEDTQQ
ncbi:MAG: sporulation protein YqfD, partial [Clostridioides sp.]|nr:sporulation protein YqfD [Clostridioides sp.]